MPRSFLLSRGIGHKIQSLPVDSSGFLEESLQCAQGEKFVVEVISLLLPPPNQRLEPVFLISRVRMEDRWSDKGESRLSQGPVRTSDRRVAVTEILPYVGAGFVVMGGRRGVGVGKCRLSLADYGRSTVLIVQAGTSLVLRGDTLLPKNPSQSSHTSKLLLRDTNY
ncbi:hypothetical protein J6590_038633 [Homalodisca vitripennis]|nr:hypothetical protein J6590_038633 [Homalodisca vitripennis]